MVSDLTTDFIVWLLPIPMVSNKPCTRFMSLLIDLRIWKLNMKTSKKLNVTGVLMLAAVEVIISGKQHGANCVPISPFSSLSIAGR